MNILKPLLENEEIHALIKNSREFTDFQRCLFNRGYKWINRGRRFMKFDNLGSVFNIVRVCQKSNSISLVSALDYSEQKGNIDIVLEG